MVVAKTQLITKTQQDKILEKTPRQFVMNRIGRGGKTLSYVETGYIIAKLNEVFNYLWDFEIVDQKIGETQVYVQGKLTAYLSPEVKITKMQYGGKDISKNSMTGKSVDIGDDLKAASSDALKKCASLFGISQDIFWPHGSETQEPVEEKSAYQEAQEHPEKYVQPVDEDPSVVTPEQEAQQEADEFYTSHPEMKEKPATNSFCKVHGVEMERKFSQAKNKWYSIHRDNDQACFGFGYK